MSGKKKRQYSRELNEIQLLIKQEISLAQEILGQMCQQEYLMLTGKIAAHDLIQTDIQSLFKQLKLIQKKRNTLTKKIIDQANLYKSLTDFLDLADEPDTEMIIMLEKCHALIKKIFEQEKRNHSLYEIIQKNGALDFANQAVRSQTIYDTKSQKPLLITIDYSDEVEP